MALDLQNFEELCLPSEFLTDEEEQQTLPIFQNCIFDSFTEAESNPDRLIAELNHQMSRRMLFEEDDNAMKWASIGSPKATLKSNGFKSNRPEPEWLIPGFQNPQVGLADYELKAKQFHFLKQQQLLKQQGSMNCPRQMLPKKQQNKAGVTCGSSSFTRSPQQQQQQNQASSGMKAVFLRPSGSCGTGTGFFLPRTIGDSPESRKKYGCSTVLIPARVLQALSSLSRSNGAPLSLPQETLMGGSEKYAVLPLAKGQKFSSSLKRTSY